MPLITFQPSGKKTNVPAGTNLLDACHRAGMGVPASCGGKGLCGKCRVRIVSGKVPPHVGYEQALSPSEAAAGWRLACLVSVESDLVVDVGETSAIRSVILTDFGGVRPEPDHEVKSVPLELPKPSLADQTCDIGRIMRGLGLEEYPRCALALMQQLARKLREHDFRINAVLFGNELLAVEKFRPESRALGLAVDIGTTTVAGLLFDLQSGQALAVASRTNPQAVHGDDVVTRIDYANRGDEARKKLQGLIVGALGEILAETCASASAETGEVFFIAVGGNTTMHHLLLGLEPVNIAASPYIPVAKRGWLTRASHVGLRAGEGARLYTVPNISAYVGGDIVAGLLAYDLHNCDETVLLVDVGTNGEIALRADGATYACSTAAGPAFEGARISCGMRAATGAISVVGKRDGKFFIETIDDAPARGLCGTGLLDAVALLLDCGLLDETGYLLDRDEAKDACPELAERIIEDKTGTAFLLAEKSNGHPHLALTQKDIREFQLAKGAVAAGVRVLLETVGKNTSDLTRVCLAGGFGSYLKPASALRTGLLPQGIKPGAVEAVGNSALAGTRLCLLSGRMRDEAERIAREVKYIELSGQLSFQEAFTDEMEFPV
jgi:uncharacterized 2Fe-2S/4Fe-4S cluster protein (DUF4445 family)